MILGSLDTLYRRLLSTPDPITGLGRVPPYGFSEENIGFCLTISRDGLAVDLTDLRKAEGNRRVPKRLSVPQSRKRTGTIPRSFYLWDKTSYTLGVERNSDTASAKTAPWVINLKTFQAFRDFHLDCLGDTNDEGLNALKAFLARWTPDQFSDPPFSNECLDTNLVFMLDGDKQYLHDRPAAQELWLSLLSSSDQGAQTKGMCLVSGSNATLSRLHPSIKGIGGQTVGGSIVSFNANAYESFGKDQGHNAPVSEKVAFTYTTALNFLLRRENGQCMTIGDTSTVFWAQAADSAHESRAVSLFTLMLNPPSSDANQTEQIRTTLERVAKGRPFQEIAPDIDPETRFFVLGLAPNASRISIRYWLDSTLGELGSNLSQHWQDVQIDPLPWRDDQPPNVWRFLIETAVGGESKNIPPRLAGELLRSILTGQPYPRMVLVQLVQRMRTEGKINGVRAALIRGVLHRDYRKGLIKENIPMSLDLERAPTGYRLGCLFALLEQIQRAALGDINASIVDRYYGTASSVPYSVFPRLIAGSQNHLSKIRKEKPGYAISLDKQLGSIIQGVPESFPKQLTIEQQGQFAIGYYHQKQSMFTKRDSVSANESVAGN